MTRSLLVWLGFCIWLLSGCDARGRTQTTSPSPKRGAALIRRYGCGNCHRIPGIWSARGVVGPSLVAFSRRDFIVGDLPNTPENVERIIEDPASVNPKTAMPKLPIDRDQARDIAAYLFSLR